MSTPQQKRRKQEKLARIGIVAKLYKRGYSVRQIRKEVMSRLNLDSYAIGTVQKDIHTLLKEWRENRIEDMSDALQLELERIDDTCRELWSQWEKSKEDYIKTTRKRKGTPFKKNGIQRNCGEDSGIQTFSVEENTSNILGLGDPAYISEIRKQLAERRKLLGLYASEKKEINGEIAFSTLLMESGVVDDAYETV